MVAEITQSHHDPRDSFCSRALVCSGFRIAATDQKRSCWRARMVDWQSYREVRAIRIGTLAFFRNRPEAFRVRKKYGSDRIAAKPFTVRRCLIIAGHLAHHVGIIKERTYRSQIRVTRHAGAKSDIPPLLSISTPHRPSPSPSPISPSPSPTAHFLYFHPNNIAFLRHTMGVISVCGISHTKSPVIGRPPRPKHN